MHWVSSAFLSNESFAIIACRTRNSGTLSEFLVDWHIEFSELTPMYVKRFSFRIKQIGPLVALIYDPRTAQNTTFRLAYNGIRGGKKTTQHKGVFIRLLL